MVIESYFLNMIESSAFFQPMASLTVHNWALFPFILRKNKNGCCHLICFFGISAAQWSKWEGDKHTGNKTKMKWYEHGIVYQENPKEESS